MAAIDEPASGVQLYLRCLAFDQSMVFLLVVFPDR
jgi:hypothetical protein